LVIGVGFIAFYTTLRYKDLTDIIVAIIPVSVWGYAIYFLNFDLKFLNSMKLKYKDY
jgi:hypothetical protein